MGLRLVWEVTTSPTERTPNPEVFEMIHRSEMSGGTIRDVQELLGYKDQTMILRYTACPRSMYERL